MGRGRAKAKQQKVARELKYNTHFTDLDALQRELGVSGEHADPPSGRSSGRDVDDGGDDDAGDDEYGYNGSSGDSDDDYESWTGTDR